VIVEKTLAASVTPLRAILLTSAAPAAKTETRWVIRIPATRVNLAEGDLFLTPSAWTADIQLPEGNMGNEAHPILKKP